MPIRLTNPPAMNYDLKRRFFNISSSLQMFFAVIFVFAAASCNKNDCESDNTGSLIIENTNAQATLHIFINKEIQAVNSVGDLTIEPGEKQSTSLPETTY
jgi:hypothetical protein